MRILILGGTREARVLADRLAREPLNDVIVSLAGSVSRPHPQAGRLRVGGFGGVDGLVAYLRDTKVDALIDATHPFAACMSANAVAASDRTGTQHLRLERPQWLRCPGDVWIEVADLPEAVRCLPPGARPFLAIGRKEIGVFANRRDLNCLMRMIDPPARDQPLPPGRLVLARPPDDPGQEAELFATHGVTHVVAKNSGGRSGHAKIAAARAKRIPVVLVRRPILPAAETAADLQEVCDWVSRRRETVAVFLRRVSED